MGENQSYNMKASQGILLNHVLAKVMKLITAHFIHYMNDCPSILEWDKRHQ